MEENENEQTDVLSKNDCVTQKSDLFDTVSKTKVYTSILNKSKFISLSFLFSEKGQCFETKDKIGSR